jgi:hypothetical protein
MQYLISLNSDYGFKKVFKDPEIARIFLQDFLNIEIEEITLLETDHKITDGAVIVRFDFRCKVNGEYIIIEMQKASYPYLIKRFYLYHCLNTALQLEFIKDAVVTTDDGKEIQVNRYSELKPTTTIVWTVESNFGFKEDSVEFNTYPKLIADFIKDDALWKQDKEAILKVRDQLSAILNEQKYDLNFHTQNRLIYVFQNNVLKNKLHKPYFKWFEFARKTLNKENQRADFEPYINNKIFSTMIQRLETGFMDPADLRRMMGDEAYEAAKKRGEKEMEDIRRWKIYEQFYQEFGDELSEERAAARWKLTMAYEEFGKQERAFERQQKESNEATAKAEKAAQEARLLAEKEKQGKKEALKVAKQEKIALLKAEKKKQAALLKAEKVKQEQLLKAEKAKQEQLLKAEKEKEHLLRLKMAQKLWSKGNSAEMIADLLEVSVSQVQEWVKTFQ